MSGELLSGQGADAALSRLIRQGMRGRFSGLDAIRARLRQARRREQERLNLEGPLQEVRERLDEILEDERRALSFKAEDDARLREQFLDSLPPDPAGAIRELKDYRFVDPEAQKKFDQLLGSYFRNLTQGMRGMSAEDMQRLRDMLAELNSMIEARDRGEPYDFDGFMHRYGDFFPGTPRSLDELLQDMARRMAAMSRLMASLSPEQRAELQALAEEMLGDMDLAFEVDRLASSLAGMFPDMPWGDPALAAGEEAMPMQATVDALERVSDYEQLDRSMRADYAGASLEDVDEERLRRTLGEDAVTDV